MNRNQVIDRLWPRAEFFNAAGAVDFSRQREMRNHLLGMGPLDFAREVQGRLANGQPPAPLASRPSAEKEWLPKNKPPDDADEITLLRYRADNYSTAGHEAYHAAAACWFIGASCIREVVSDGPEGFIRYGCENPQLKRLVILAPVVALAPGCRLKSPGYSHDRQSYLEQLRLSGVTGRDDLDVLSSWQSQDDETAIDEMLGYVHEFAGTLTGRLANAGRLSGERVKILWELFLFNNPSARAAAPSERK